jgi:hypothetical protein
MVEPVILELELSKQKDRALTSLSRAKSYQIKAYTVKMQIEKEKEKSIREGSSLTFSSPSRARALD